jgi:hypothetical protein
MGILLIMADLAPDDRVPLTALGLARHFMGALCRQWLAKPS